MKIKIGKCSPQGRVFAPPSKSYAHRLLICSALANGSTVIDGISDSEDMGATLDCIRALGGSFTKSGHSVLFENVKSLSADGKELFCRES